VKKKRLIMLFLQLGLVVGFSASFYTYVQKEVEPTKVYTYSQDLNISEKVKLTVKEIPKQAVQEGMVLADKNHKQVDLEKKVTNTKVLSGQFVYDKQLVKASDIDPFETMDLTKYRKVSLPITYVDGFGGDIKRGDRVDLVFTGQGKKADVGGEKTFQYSKAFLQDVLVYNVTTDTGYQFDNHSKQVEGAVANGSNGDKLQTSDASGELAVVTLAVKLDQAEEIEARKSLGTISFASRFNDNQSYETLGFVIGDYDKVFSGFVNAETGRPTINSGQ
jgi:pilus assembly protein CpaB